MSSRTGGRVGPKEPASGGQAACASQDPIVTDTMLAILQEGGNAIDAAIAGALVQATVQQDMTNHAGTISMLFWDEAAGEVHELNSSGTIVPELPPLRPIPLGYGLYSQTVQPFAVIPGLMPGLKEMHERFGTRPWASLCEPSIRWAEDGHAVGSFEHLVMAQTVDYFLYTESGREHFTPDGHLPQVGDRAPNPALAGALKRLATNGPDEFITGEWARRFIARANELGWPIELKHMTAIPPRWSGGTRWSHRGYEIVQPSPPERQAVYCSIVLGILDELDITSLGHYTESAESLYYFAHALRRAEFETGYINDPTVFEDPSATLMSRDYRRQLAAALRDTKPKVDMTKHVEIVAGKPALRAAGLRPGESEQPPGSSELSVVDARGNWVQLMNTLQSGGIPGEVVEGVPMVGSHVRPALDAPIAGWFAGGGRIRSVMGNTMVLKDGKPWLTLGSPGNVYCTVPQVLSNIVDFGMDPYEAEDAPRMLPMQPDYTVGVESRIDQTLVAGLARLGVQVKPLPRYDYHMGSYQMSWRADDGTLRSTAGPRRAGAAAAY